MTCPYAARGLVAALLICTGCARELPGEDPPEQGFYFPIGATEMAAAPGQPLLYVLSSNFDLRFNSGWVTVIDATEARTLADTGDASGAELQRLLVPSLGGELAGGTLADGRRILVSAHRGEPKIAVMEVGDDGRIHCGNPRATEGLSSADEHTDCDARHLVNITLEEGPWHREAPIAELAVRDPYSVVVVTPPGSTTTYVMVGFISSGLVLVFEVRLDDADAVLAPRAAVITSNSGIGTLTQHPDPTHAFVVGTSRIFNNDSRRSAVYIIDLERVLEDEIAAGTGTVRSDERRGVQIVSLNSQTGGQELVDLTFSPDGAFAYTSNNSPDAIFVLDASLASFEQPLDDGTFTEVLRPKMTLISAVPQPGQPSGVAYMSGPEGDVLVAASFNDDALFVSGAAGAELVLARRLDDVGLGPYALEPVDVGRPVPVLFITSFFEHSVALVDVPFDDLPATERAGLMRNPELGVSLEQR